MRKTYRKSCTTVEYLENVLNTWTAFCEVNYGLAQAISDLLRENEVLRAQLRAKEKATPKRD